MCVCVCVCVYYIYITHTHTNTHTHTGGGGHGGPRTGEGFSQPGLPCPVRHHVRQGASSTSACVCFCGLCLCLCHVCVWVSAALRCFSRVAVFAKVCMVVGLYFKCFYLRSSWFCQLVTSIFQGMYSDGLNACVCVCERERERESVCVCVCV